MIAYEYKAVPVPRKSLAGRVFGNTDAMSLPQAVNALADEGWTFVRSDSLPFPSPARIIPGLKMRRDVLVFRRPRTTDGRAPLGTGREAAITRDDCVRDVSSLLDGLRPLSAARAA